MSAVKFHPDESVLFDYATGALTAAPSVVIACHLTLCPECRGLVTSYEKIGGVLMAEEPVANGVPVEPQVPKEGPETALAKTVPPQAPEGFENIWTQLPRPAQRELAVRQGVRWQGFYPGMREVNLTPEDGSELTLYRLQPGTAMPRHRHAGDEMTMVLSGGFSDQSGSYGPGDVASADESVVHRPVADPGEPCICLASVTGRVQLTGVMGVLSRLIPGG